ncbi:MAG: ATP synthase F1 subunit epsilon [Rhodospirillales bacterium]|nr:ATP synthase F1 subunit epsilon [Rhodospirillales bacterium]
MAANETTHKTFSFDLISPERRVMSTPARAVTVPGEAGEFGVLSGHMALLSDLRPGVVFVEVEGESAPRRIFITGGFADVTPDHCAILAEEAIPVEMLDGAAIDAALNDLAEDLTLARDDASRARIVARIEIERARLNAVQA